MKRDWIWFAVGAVAYAAFTALHFLWDDRDRLDSVVWFFLALVMAGRAIGGYRGRNDPPRPALSPRMSRFAALAAGLGVTFFLTLAVVIGNGAPWWYALLLAVPAAVPVVLIWWPRTPSPNTAANGA